MYNIRRDICNIRMDMYNIRRDICNIRRDMYNIRRDITTLEVICTTRGCPATDYNGTQSEYLVNSDTVIQWIFSEQ